MASSVVDARLTLPFGMIISGPPKSGKTTFVLELLDNMRRILNREIDYIVWFFGEYNNVIRQIEQDARIYVVNKIPDNIDGYIRLDGSYGLFVFDDLMRQAAGNSDLVDIATKKCNHANLSWILLMQDLFYKFLIV